MQGDSSFAEMQGRYEIVDFVSALFITSSRNVQKWKGNKMESMRDTKRIMERVMFVIFWLSVHRFNLKGLNWMQAAIRRSHQKRN